MLNRLMNLLGRFSYNMRYFIVVLFVLLLILVSMLQSKITISYSYEEENKINEVFQEPDQLVILYENKDENKINYVIEELTNDQGVNKVTSYANSIGLELSNVELAHSIGMDSTFIHTIYYLYTYGFETEGMTIPSFINFMVSDVMENDQFRAYFDEQTRVSLLSYSAMINRIVSGYEFNSTELAGLTEIDSAFIDQLFLGQEVTKMTLPAFLEYIMNFILINPQYSSYFTDAEKIKLQQMISFCDLIANNVSLSAKQIAEAFPIQSERFNENTINLLYLVYYSQQTDISHVKISMIDFINFIIDEEVPNPSFAFFFDEDTKANLMSIQTQLEEGKAQLLGEQYSRILVTINYEKESQEINQFYERLTQRLEKDLEGNYYLIGDSAMSYEMSQTFGLEFLFISLLTAVAIFIVIALTFRKITVPAILVLIIQCGIFTAMSVMYVRDVSMYYIALLIVQCLLMGSTVDYGILYTSYYQELRKNLPVKEALCETYKKSIHTILTSACIMIGVTAIISVFISGAISQICSTIAIGATAATLLILFVLPAFLSTFDKFVVKKNNI